jgi:hypothetical protein
MGEGGADGAYKKNIRKILKTRLAKNKSEPYDLQYVESETFRD